MEKDIKKLINALEEIEKLLRKWGISENDWMLTHKDALILQRYNFRLGHNLDIFVDRFKLPWKVKEDFQTIPPRDSKELDDYINCIEKIGLGIHFIPLPQGKIREKEIKKSTTLYRLPNKKEIRLHLPGAEVKTFEYLLLFKCSLKKFDLAFIIRGLSYIKEIKREAIKKKDKNLIELTSKAIKKISRKYSLPK